ncbi:hypothetical protein AAIR98_000773 [Elusimicrobium simillimum]|uniref:winged helix-turn-helix domain-containing protein n=1 Tax=Elusimicrobium simillimum TaxID=3143438 RepID=UPI003C70569F
MTENIKENAANILSFVKERGAATAWDIKLHFRFSSSMLYLALGALAAEGKIDITQQGLDYKITVL